MMELQTTLPDEQFLSVDDHYLDELTDRIAKLRMLHEQMDNKPEPWGWLKTFSE